MPHNNLISGAFWGDTKWWWIQNGGQTGNTRTILCKGFKKEVSRATVVINGDHGYLRLKNGQMVLWFEHLWRQRSLAPQGEKFYLCPLLTVLGFHLAGHLLLFLKKHTWVFKKCDFSPGTWNGRVHSAIPGLCQLILLQGADQAYQELLLLLQQLTSTSLSFH